MPCTCYLIMGYQTVCKLNVVSEHSFKEGITSLELADLTKDGKAELVLATMEGDLRILRIGAELEEIAKVSCNAPVATLGLGDLVGDDLPELVVGSMDNKLSVPSVISYCFPQFLMLAGFMLTLQVSRS